MNSLIDISSTYFQILKTSKDESQISSKVSDRLIIQKTSDTNGRLYFDYDANTRIALNEYSPIRRYSGTFTNVDKPITIKMTDIYSIDGDEVNTMNQFQLLIDENQNLGIVLSVDMEQPIPICQAIGLIISFTEKDVRQLVCIEQYVKN